MDPTIQQFQARFTFYAMANNMTAEQCVKHCSRIFPEACMSGFISWLSIGKKKFAEAHPEHMLGDKITSQTAFTQFLGESVKEYLGL